RYVVTDLDAIDVQGIPVLGHESFDDARLLQALEFDVPVGLGLAGEHLAIDLGAFRPVLAGLRLEIRQLAVVLRTDGFIRVIATEGWYLSSRMRPTRRPPPPATPSPVAPTPPAPCG